MIGLLLPTRGRADALRESVTGLLTLADDPGRVRIGYAVDPDDPTTAQAAARLQRPGDRLWVAPERYGYAGLHHYINHLAATLAPEVDWLLVWNDDARMATQGWDRIIAAFSGRDRVLDPQTDHDNHMPLFPVIPARYVRALGHLSLSPHCDSWWDLLTQTLGILEAIPVRVHHEAFGVAQDRTATESRAGYRSGEFFGEELTAARLADATRLLDVIGRAA